MRSELASTALVKLIGKLISGFKIQSATKGFLVLVRSLAFARRAAFSLCRKGWLSFLCKFFLFPLQNQTFDGANILIKVLVCSTLGSCHGKTESRLYLTLEDVSAD